ncbi:hypothetical protein [Pararhizobium arenae]|uniref:hypothetical protein n=1 Tax=Pararhizobium arenae TaxID=1856850 RepID=UPI00094AF2FE|nr:hypothetical protein [Pararhizobium arenae]
MALEGLHVLAGYAGARGYKDSVQPLITKRMWSETLPEAGETTNVAPRAGDVAGQPVFQLRCSVDAWISIRPNPDAALSPRAFLPADETVDWFVEPGDKLDWAPVDA